MEIEVEKNLKNHVYLWFLYQQDIFGRPNSSGWEFVNNMARPA